MPSDTTADHVRDDLLLEKRFHVEEAICDDVVAFGVLPLPCSEVRDRRTTALRNLVVSSLLQLEW